MFESHPDITIRRLGDADRDALERLAQRDSSPIPTGDLLAAVAPGGALLAAISLEAGHVVADPFLPSEPAVSLLRVRAGQIAPVNKDRGARGRRRSRGALTLAGLRPPT